MICPICLRPEPECDCIRDAERRPIAPAPRIDPAYEIYRSRIDDEAPEEVSADELKSRVCFDNVVARYLHDSLEGGY